MKRFSANYVIPINGRPIKNGIIETDDIGTILEVYDFGGEMRELAHTQFLNGVLVPGLINMHVHLELSWMNSLQKPTNGLPSFIEQMIKKQNPPDAAKLMAEADDFMFRRGIVGACDISNTEQSIDVKRNSKIRYHTMVEVSGLKTENAAKRLETITDLLDKFKAAGLSASIAPHAPYSVSNALWELLQKELNQQVVSIHNQESESENEMFIAGTGKLIETFRSLQIIDSQWKPTTKTSLHSVLKYLQNTKLLLVHNTFTSNADIAQLLQTKPNDTGIVFCPSSNLHIEEKLPNIELFKKSNLPLMLGTDSTASGKSLSLLDEMLILQEYCNVSFEETLCWSTQNAAKFMDWHDLGTFETGKRPGINLISHFDFDNFKLKPNSTIRRVL